MGSWVGEGLMGMAGRGTKVGKSQYGRSGYGKQMKWQWDDR